MLITLTPEEPLLQEWIEYTVTRLIDSPTYVNPPIHPGGTNSRKGMVWGFQQKC
ncbi:hypothetical protein [Microcoleus sp. S28C3]|uniref:hypothetical protein n=1 Tax=Microcoleus sp. S28C3 TaxID=3055414 RepID=UPI002FD405F7